MKRVAFVLCLLLLAAPVMAQTMEFAWDPHPQATDLAGFKLYQSKQSGNYGTTPVATFTGGATTSGTIAVPSPGRYYWVLTAFTADGIESDHSNEVTQVVKPKPPKLNAVQQVAQAVKGAVTKVAELVKPKTNLRIVE